MSDENKINNLINNQNLDNSLKNEITNIKEQKSFFETTIGKTINFALDLGLRAVLPDIIENQVIEVKDTILKNGFNEGIKQTINSAIDIGKSALGIVTGKFETLSQAQNAIRKGGIVDNISTLLDFGINKIGNNTKIPKVVFNQIKQGKNIILNTITSNIENQFTKQLTSIEKLENYQNKWTQYYNNKDFSGMQREYKKIESTMPDIMPIENTIKEIRKLENLHNLIKNRNGIFNLTKEEVLLAEKLVS